MNTLPNRLRAARAVSGLSLDRLSEEVGVHRHRLSRWERGHDEIPDLMRPGVVSAVAKATGFPEAFFTEGVN